jgi:hypothetical protein
VSFIPVGSLKVKPAERLLVYVPLKPLPGLGLVTINGTQPVVELEPVVEVRSRLKFDVVVDYVDVVVVVVENDDGRSLVTVGTPVPLVPPVAQVAVAV